MPQHTPFAVFSKRREAYDAWAAANPKLAADWDEALLERDAREATKEAAARAKAAAVKLAAACRTVGLPLRALQALATPRETEATKALPAPDTGLILLAGPAGTGKTVAAVRVAREALRAALEANPERVSEDPSRTVLFLRAVTLARSSAYGSDAAEQIERITSTRLLVLDDLGAEYASPVWDMLLFEVLDTRHGNLLPTLVTTNLGRDALRERYGQRLAERVRESGAAVYLNGESMRGQP